MDKDRLNKMLFTHLTTLRQWGSSYHNHKENASWAAIALFLAVVGSSIGLGAASASPETRIALAVGLIAGAVIIHLFVWKQNSLRTLGYEIEAGCDLLILQILRGHEFTAEDCGPGADLPELARIDNAFRFPKCLLRAICEIRTRPQPARAPIFLIGYLLIWISAFITVYLIFPYSL